MDLNTAKEIATIAAPVTGAIVNAFLKPKLDSLFEILKIKKKLLEHEVINKLTDYLIRAYDRQAYVKTVVFQNNKILLRDLYIPLSVSNPNTEESVKIIGYAKQLLPVHEKVLLVDTAGMGKSTLSRFLFLKCIEEAHGIPVFIELRKLKQGLTIIDIINEDLNRIDEAVDRGFLLKLIEAGDFVFFFDGFDEIPIKEREFATQHLQDFIAKVPKNKFLITSRQDPALASFADFQKFVIKPLRQSEAFALLRKYDKDGPTSEALVEKLKAEHHKENLKSFLVNPLLVSLLFKAYDFKPTLPLRADVFYRQVYEALFENHDLAKGGSFIRQKHSNLNIDDFAKVLRVLAMRTAALGKVEYSSDEILGHIRDAKERCSGLVFTESDFVKDLISTVPLFVQDGLDYRWNHKSFQEYFAALFIATDAKAEADIILQRLVDSKEQLRFLNLLELSYDIDPITFHRALTFRLVVEMREYMNELVYKKKYPAVPEDEVLNRKLICFGRRFVLFSTSKVNELAGYDVRFDPAKIHQCMRDFIEHEGYLQEDERVGSSTAFPTGSGLVVFQKPNVMVLEILFRKRHIIAVDMKTTAYKKTLKNYGILSSASFLKGKEVVVLTDAIGDELNKPSNFDRITYLLVDNEKIRIGADPEACRKTAQEIEMIEKKRSTVDVLAGI